MYNSSVKKFFNLIEGKNVLLTSFNHSLFNGVSDHISFLINVLSERCNLSYSRDLIPADYVVIIEYFDDNILNKLYEYLVSNRHSKIIIVLTEHLDLIDDNIFFHGVSYNDADDYMSPSDKKMRLVGILKTKFIAEMYITLLNLPELIGFDKLMGVREVVRLPYNLIEYKIIRSQPEYDFIFFGKITKYREMIIEKIKTQFSIKVECTFIDDFHLANLIAKSRIVLNIPQSRDWKWISLMRIIKSLNLGFPVISISSDMKGNFNNFVKTIDINDTLACEKLAYNLEHSQELLKKEIKDFNEAMRKFGSLD